MHGLPNNIVVTDIENAFTVTAPKGHTSVIPKRKSYGFSFCMEGSLTYTHNGKQYVEDRQHAVLLPMGQSYTLVCNEAHVSPVVNFHCLEFLCDAPVVIPIEHPDLFKKDYEKLLSLRLFEDTHMQQMSVFYSILHRLLLPPVSLTLAPALKHIENNYFDPNLNNGDLAQQCRISEVYFRKLFVEQYQTTPRQFIIDFRINKAKQLLSEGVLKISAISEQCGFSNPYHFCRSFKKQVGVTPTEYMIQNRIFKI